MSRRSRNNKTTADDVKVLKNVPIPQGSSLEFMGGNKVVLEAADTLTVDSDSNNSVDVTLTINGDNIRWRIPVLHRVSSNPMKTMM